jgi:hypothetical protein
MATVRRRVSARLRTWRIDRQSILAAHERVYRRAGTHDLLSILTTFQVSPREAGELFGVTRQAIGLWLEEGVPPNRLAGVARAADVARRLRRTFKRERIPAIVRQANPGLGGATVLEALAQPEGPERVMDALDRLTSYVPAGAAPTDPPQTDAVTAYAHSISSG